MKKWMLILSCLILSLGFSIAQTTRISGVVVDDTGEAVIGASVVVKGSTTGTITDVDGNFSLNVPQGTKTLVVSLIGMEAKEIAPSQNMRIVLSPDTELLDEVMVVAYGTAKKSSFTGSAAVVKSDAISQRSVANVTSALAGQVAGVQVLNLDGGQPGSANSATVRIRGFGSLSASNNPLYVVDGVPFDGNISSINPQDIESMTVLKDAAANAIYGARGANGVVLITTKNGSSGNAVVRVDAKWGSNSRAVPNYEVMTDPKLYYETYYRAMYNSQAYNGKSPAEAHTFANANLTGSDNKGLGYQVYTIPTGERLVGTNFKLNPNAKLGYTDGQYYYSPDSWYDELFDKGNLRQEYNISVSGGNDKTNYYISGGYLDDSGLISGSGFERFTGRARVESQAKKWLKVGANVGYTYYNIQSPGAQTDWGSSGNIFFLANNMAPIYPMYVRNTDGTVKVDSHGYTVYDFGNNTNFDRAFMNGANPAITLTLDKYNAFTDVITSKWFAEITPLEGLKLAGNIGANVRNIRENKLYNPFYGSAVPSDGSAYVRHYREFGVNQQYLATYNKNINSVHNIDLLAGYEGYTLKIQKLEGYNKQLYNPWVGELSNAIGTPPDVASSTDNYATAGFLSRVQYDYNGKYFLSASYRRDGSSRFHKDNRWGSFGSIGAAWLMTKENFMKSINWVDMLKFKASYGEQGNDNLLNYYAYTDQYEIGESNKDFALSLYYKGNKDLTWEKSKAFNTGFDFELFKGKLTGSIEYFSRKTSDLLYNQPVPISAGYTSYPRNVGSITNKGFELDLNGVVYKNKDIEARVFANLTYVKGKINDLAESVRETGIKSGGRIIRVGGSWYNAYLVKYAGVDQTTGKALYYKDPDNGNWTTTDDYTQAKQSDLGSAMPEWFGGFGTQLNAYGFDFSIQFSYQLGGKVYDGTYEGLMHSGDLAGQNWHKDILKAWTVDNPSSSIPRLSTGDVSSQRTSDRFLMSSDYLSLNSIVVGYTFPKKLTNKLAIEGLRIYFTGENLALISCRKGFDPRTYVAGGGSTASGNFNYSPIRSLSGGINLTF